MRTLSGRQRHVFAYSPNGNQLGIAKFTASARL